MIKVLETIKLKNPVLICSKFDQHDVGHQLLIHESKSTIAVNQFLIDQPKPCFSVPSTTNVIVLDKKDLSECGTILNIGFEDD